MHLSHHALATPSTTFTASDPWIVSSQLATLSTTFSRTLLVRVFGTYTWKARMKRKRIYKKKEVLLLPREDFLERERKWNRKVNSVLLDKIKVKHIWETYPRELLMITFFINCLSHTLPCLWTTLLALSLCNHSIVIVFLSLH